MTKSIPLVSVIVPAFNAEATLAEALGSALAQTYRNIEIIVVDDGSTDATAAIARRFAAADGRVSLIGKSNGGISSARNAGIAASKGVYIAPLDADDLWHPTKIEKQVMAAEGAADPPGFVYCWRRLIDAEGRVRGSGEPWHFRGRVIHRHLYKNFVAAGGQLLIARSALIEAGGYDERLLRCEDILLQFQIASRHPVEVVPEYLIGYRRIPGQMSANRREMLLHWKLVRKLARETCPGVRHGCDRWMHARQYYHFGVAALLGRRYFAGAAYVLAAGVRDPLWTFGHFRLQLARRLDRGRPVAAGIMFDEADSNAHISGDENEKSRAGDWLKRLDERRLTMLARLDLSQPA